MENNMGITCTVTDRIVKIYYNDNWIATLKISDKVSDPEDFNSYLARHFISTIYNLDLFNIIDADLSQYIHDGFLDGYGNGDEDTLDEYKRVIENFTLSDKYFEKVF